MPNLDFMNKKVLLATLLMSMSFVHSNNTVFYGEFKK